MPLQQAVGSNPAALLLDIREGKREKTGPVHGGCEPKRK